MDKCVVCGKNIKEVRYWIQAKHVNQLYGKRVPLCTICYKQVEVTNG